MTMGNKGQFCAKEFKTPIEAISSMANDSKTMDQSSLDAE